MGSRVGPRERQKPVCRLTGALNLTSGAGFASLLAELLRYARNMKHMKHLPVRGFTLIELMVTVAIVAILALIVYPNYMDSIRKSRRQEAINALNSLQLAQERYRANHPTYGSLADLTSTYGTSGISGTTGSGYYTLTVTSPTSTGYIATATAVAGKSQVNDRAGGVSCATLSVNQEQPVDSNPVQALSLQKACWGR